MTLIRIGRPATDCNANSLESLGKLKGLYGIECVAFDDSVEFFLFIKDKYIRNLVQSDTKNSFSIYLNAFGIKGENFENIELVDNNYVQNNFCTRSSLLKGYYDFTQVQITSMFKNSQDNRNYSAKNLNYYSNLTTLTNSYNLLSETILYLREINAHFIIQLFYTTNKKEHLVSGQLIVFKPVSDANSNLLLQAIRQKIKNLAIKFKTEFNEIPKLNIISNLNKKTFFEHKPFKNYPKSGLIINEILKIPDLSFLTKNKADISEDRDLFDSISLDDGIPIGYKIVSGLKDPSIIKLTYEDLSSHFCCFGITSQGKSRLMYNFLSFIDKTAKHFLVIDPKGEYFEALASSKKPVLYFKVGSLEFPLMVNIFSIPKGLSTEDHIQFIYSLLLSIMGDEVTPQMNRLLFRATEYVIENNGNMKNFLSLLEHPEKLKIKGSYLELSGNAVLNRILPLVIGPAKNCFLTKSASINFFDLINQNVIIDLSSFELVESTISRKVFVNTFLHYFIHAIRFQNTGIRNVGDISNFILLEEIQKIAPLSFQGKNEINSFIGLAPWTVRAYGICMGFIGTDPKVETPIITNTGLSMIFYAKSNVDNLLKLLGVPYKEYTSFLQDIQERRKFLLCYKGKITLLKSFNFPIPDGETIRDRYQFMLDWQREH